MHDGPPSDEGTVETVSPTLFDQEVQFHQPVERLTDFGAALEAEPPPHRAAVQHGLASGYRPEYVLLRSR